MVSVKRNESITLKAKNVMIVNGEFCDSETGEIIDLGSICYSCFGDNEFDISITQKSDSDVTPMNE